MFVISTTYKLWLCCNYFEIFRNSTRDSSNSTQNDVLCSAHCGVAYIYLFIFTLSSTVSDSEILTVLYAQNQQQSSAKLTNQRVSYAFTSSQFSFHARHILPTSKFQHSYSCIFTAQCTLVQMRGIGIACRLSVCPSVRL